MSDPANRPRPSEAEIEEVAIRLAAYFASRVEAAEVEELVQETLVRALGSGWEPGRGTFGQYVFGSVARSVLRDHLRDRWRRAVLSADMEAAFEPHPESEIDRAAALARLRDLASGDPLVTMMLDHQAGDDPWGAMLWRALEVSPLERRNARRRLARLLRRLGPK